MKKSNHFSFRKVGYMILFATLLLAGDACKKGDVGPIGLTGERGERGERGEKGETGSKGIPGTDGNSILYGNVAPTASSGKVGDFYIDKKNENLYGPKTASGWGAAVNMRGATGATGARGATGERGITGASGPKGEKGDTGAKGATGARGATGATGAKGDAGSQFLSGATAPATGTGKPGDFYFNTATGQLYGPKNTNNTWAAGISLKGPKGDKGDKGDTGSANVVSSGWIGYDINSTPNTTTYKTMRYVFPAEVLSHINATQISDFLADGGLLIVYGKNFGNGNHNIFPYTYNNVEYTWAGGSFGVNSTNAIYITIRSTDGTALTEYDYEAFKGNQFRYILIPAGIQVMGMGPASDIDWSKINYSQAKQILNLKD